MIHWCCRPGTGRNRRRADTEVRVQLGWLVVMCVKKCEACAQALVDRLEDRNPRSPLFGARVSVRPL